MQTESHTEKLDVRRADTQTATGRQTEINIHTEQEPYIQRRRHQETDTDREAYIQRVSGHTARKQHIRKYRRGQTLTVTYRQTETATETETDRDTQRDTQRDIQ